MANVDTSRHGNVAAGGPTRSVDGVELPAPGEWVIDAGHSEVAFIGRHFLLTRIRGRFTGVSGSLAVAEDPAASSLEVIIDMASVSSGDQARDDHLRSHDFFDVAQHPTARYVARSVRWSGTRGVVDGELTIKGTTRPVPLHAELLGCVRDPWGGDRAVFSAAGTLNREDFGLSWNMVLEAGGLLVSRDIAIEIDLEAVRQA
jgi:polyisoprenoid-binding protein YceI